MWSVGRSVGLLVGGCNLSMCLVRFCSLMFYNLTSTTFHLQLIATHSIFVCIVYVYERLRMCVYMWHIILLTNRILVHTKTITTEAIAMKTALELILSFRIPHICTFSM